MDKLQPDPLRAKVGFSPEMRSALDISLAFEPGKEEEVSKELNEWVRKHQPCLFGRIVAKQSAIIHCLISENMLYGSEVELEKQIQNARLRWTRAGFEGHSSNFIISVLSKKLATALPDESVKAIAIRLCSLYLKEPVEPDRVYLDRL